MLNLHRTGRTRDRQEKEIGPGTERVGTMCFSLLYCSLHYPLRQKYKNSIKRPCSDLNTHAHARTHSVDVSINHCQFCDSPFACFDVGGVCQVFSWVELRGGSSVTGNPWPMFSGLFNVGCRHIWCACATSSMHLSCTHFSNCLVLCVCVSKSLVCNNVQWPCVIKH